MAEVLIKKTQGNPFFLRQLLQYLYEEEKIVFDLNQRAWNWDLEEIQYVGITENVVALMMEKIQKMPEKIKSQLQVAACIGAHFDLLTLSIISGQSVEETKNNLLPALEEGFVILKNDVFNRMEAGSREPGEHDLSAFNQPLNSSYRFGHDRIWHTVYSLISDIDKQKLHLRIGFLYSESLEQREKDEMVFKIANQLNSGIGSLSDPEKRLDLARLNLIAGKKAKASAAFRPSLNYLNSGISLLTEKSWEQNYGLTFDLYSEAAESAFFCRDFEQMERLADLSLHHAGSVLDKAKIYSLRIQRYYAKNELLKVIEEGLAILKLLGYRFPNDPNAFHIALKLAATKLALTGKNASVVNEFKDIHDPETLAAMRIMVHLAHAAYGARPKLSPLICFQGILLSLKHGIAPETPVSFSFYGMILCSALNQIQAGYNFGQLALSLNERPSIIKFRARTIFIVGSMIAHWKNHLKDSLGLYLLNARKTGMEVGDFEYSTLAAFFYCAYSYFVGKPLKDLSAEMFRYSDEIIHCKQNTHFQFNEMTRQVLLNLMRKSEDPCRLKGDAYDEEEMLPVHRKSNDTSAIHMLFSYKLQLSFLFGKYKDAIKYSQTVEKYLDSMIGTYYIPIFYFYDSLARLSAFGSMNKKMKGEFLKKIRRNQKKLNRWARHAPMNYRSKWMLVEAECLKFAGSHMKAIEHYDKSISLAHDHGYLQEEALGNELAARFWLNRGNYEIAEVYLQKAAYCYEMWGAKAKVHFLYETYPQLLRTKNQDSSSDSCKNQLSSVTTGASSLMDLNSVIKAHQTISSEIFLDELMRKLMTVVIENAGAQKALLLSQTGSQWVIEAEGHASRQGIAVLVESKTARASDVPISILDFTALTQKTVLLNDAAQQGAFTREAYVRVNRPRSLLSAPLLHEGKLKYVIYLENNLISGAFTLDRLELIQLLSAQAAISLENAGLYERIQESEKKYRGIFEHAVEGIFQIGTNGRFISVNNAMANILGYHCPEELMAASKDVAYDFFANTEDKKKIGEILSHTGKVFGFEGRGIRKNGNEFWGTLSIQPVLDADGNLKFYEGSLVDITEKVKREKAERDREAAQAIAAAKSEFLANMSHEIRTPMNAIIGLTELLSKTDHPDKRNEYMAKIKDASGTLVKIIDDILDFSKIEAGKLELEQEDFSITCIFDKVALMFSNLATEKKIELKFSISKEIPGTLRGDSLRLGQVLINLVGNSMKFTHEGEIHIKTELVEKGKDSLILNFCVMDTGIGIPAEKISMLFQPFTQTDGSITRRYGGTGLGLAICRSIVDKMGGRIWAESRQDAGSCFIFEVQLGYSPENRGLTKMSDDLKYSRSLVPDLFNEHLHILLVEDNPINSQIIEGLLESSHIKVSAVNNGEDALKAIETFDYDTVLMDVQMPGIDGYEVTRRIREDPLRQNLPIIALTAQAAGDFREKCLGAGMNDYLTKPVDSQQLLSKLSLHLNAEKSECSHNLPDEKLSEKENQIELPEDLPGIDISAGLKRMAGRRHLYMAVLKEFYKDYENISEILRNAQKKGDTDFIYRTAHTIKGLAGNIGAESLKSAVEALEAKSKKADAVIDNSYFEKFDTQLKIVLDAIKGMDSIIDDAQGAFATYEKKGPDEILKMVAELNHLLSDGQSRALAYYKSMSHYFLHSDLNELKQRLQRCIENYDFEDAIKILAEIRKFLDGKIKGDVDDKYQTKSSYSR